MAWTTIAAGNATLEQGDLLRGVRVLVPLNVPEPTADGELVFTGDDLVVQATDVVVMSQTCDLERSAEDAKRGDPLRIAQVVCCRTLQVKDSGLGKKKLDPALKQNTSFLHCLPPLETADTDTTSDVGEWWLIHFNDVLTLPYTYVVQFASTRERSRLDSPHRESLSHRFGDFFSRPAVDVPTPDLSAYKAGQPLDLRR
ncbi:MAG: hypothetical protein KDC46_09870 [Thermoleophilia bacterium]|nr:hypothetical protein [Thermoleophilia bacterium]